MVRRATLSRWFVDEAIRSGFVDKISEACHVSLDEAETELLTHSIKYLGSNIPNRAPAMSLIGDSSGRIYTKIADSRLMALVHNGSTYYEFSTCPGDAPSGLRSYVSDLVFRLRKSSVRNYAREVSQVALNQRLIEKQGLTPGEVARLAEVHAEKGQVMLAMDSTLNPVKLKKLAKRATQLEFTLQDIWKFKRDRSMHRWFEVPGCCCPFYDNMDRLGKTIDGIYSEHCLVHS